jgi:hypothetical protein
MNLFKWANVFFSGTQKQRIKVVDTVLEAIKIFKKGRKSPEGDKAYKFITSNKVELIGVVPNINYIRVQSRVKEDLDALWDHHFSVPTLLYRIKDSPFLLLANPNVEYNNSKLLEIASNANLEELKNIAGIIG